MYKNEFWQITSGGGGGGNSVMDKHPIQAGVEILLVASYAKETGIRSALLGHLAQMQTSPYLKLSISWTSF